MKRILFGLVLMAAFLASCTKDDFPKERDMIEFPDSGYFGANILSSAISFESGLNGMPDGNGLSMAANITGNITLMVTVRAVEVNMPVGDYKPEEPAPAESPIMIEAGPNGPINYIVYRYDATDRSQSYESIEPDSKCDLHIWLYPGTYEVTYITNDDLPVTKTITITDQTQPVVKDIEFTHNRTKMVMAGESLNEASFEAAKAACESFRGGGWRMPDDSELRNMQGYAGGWGSNIFNLAENGKLWTSGTDGCSTGEHLVACILSPANAEYTPQGDANSYRVIPVKAL